MEQVTLSENHESLITWELFLFNGLAASPRESHQQGYAKHDQGAQNGRQNGGKRRIGYPREEITRDHFITGAGRFLQETGLPGDPH